MPSSGSSNFDFDLFHFLGFTNEFRIFSAFLHSSETVGSFVSLDRQPYEVGHLLHSEEDIGLLNCFCKVYLVPPEVLTLEADHLCSPLYLEFWRGRFRRFHCAAIGCFP